MQLTNNNNKIYKNFKHLNLTYAPQLDAKKENITNNLWYYYFIEQNTLFRKYYY